MDRQLSYKIYQNPLVSRLVQERRPILFLGDTGTYKTWMIEELLKNLRTKALIVNLDRKERKERYQGLDVMHCHGFDESNAKNYADKWLLPRAYGRILIFEDLPDFFTFGNPRTKQDAIDAILTKIRYILFATAQHLRGKVWTVARAFKNIVLCPLTDLSNLQKITGSRAIYNEIRRRQEDLGIGEYLLFEPRTRLISSQPYSHENIKPIIRCMLYGLGSLESYSPTAQKETKPEAEKLDPETLYTKVAKAFYETPCATYREIATKLDVATSTIGSIVDICRREKGYLPKTPKRYWNRKMIGSCLEQRGILGKTN